MNKLKSLALASVMCLLAFSAANAEKVYSASSGDWGITGHQKGSDMSCVISTSWKDGSRINLNIFPRRNGDQYTTLTVLNPRWNLPKTAIGQTLNLKISFFGNGFEELDADFQVYKKNAVILRGLSKAFDKLFKNNSLMILFTGMKEELKVGLKGTKEIGYYLTDCIKTVKSTTY